MAGNISTKPDLLGKTMFGEKVYTAEQVDELIRQAAPVMDDTPTIGSDNPVKSNGIAVRINDVVDELNERIDQSVSGLFRYCGSVRSYDDLPWPNPEDSVETLRKGDTYNVVEGYEDSNEEIPPGTNWAWNGVRWDPLAGSLADYLSKQAAAETYVTKQELSAHTGDTRNPHNVTKDQVGLGNVDNTADTDKPVSTATRTELDKKLDKTEASETYATKTELSAHTGNTSNPHQVTKDQVGLGNVDNTSDVNKPVSTATQVELDKKLDSSVAAETYATKTELSTHTGNTSNPHGVTKSQVGLGNVDNTSDANKPVSTATQTELDKKLDKTEAATTYATQAAVANKVDKVSGKGLSTNDFTNSEKSKLSGIETGAQVNTIYDVFGAYNDSCITGNAQPESINAPDGPIVLTPMDRLYAYPDMDGNVKLGDFAVNFINEMDIPSRELMSEWQWSVSDPEYAKTSEVQPVYDTDLGEWMLPPESELVTKLGMYIDGGENNDSMATYLTVIGYSVEYEITVDTGLSYADFTNDGFGQIGAHAHFTYADGSTAEIVYDVNVNPLGVYSMEYDHTNNSWRIQVDTPSALPGTSDPFTSEMVAACHAVLTVETETDASDQSTWADPNGLNAGDMMRVFGGVDVYANFTRTSSGTERYLGDVMLPPSPNCNWTRPASDGYASHFILEIWVPQEGMSGPSFVHSDDDMSIMLVDGGISMTAGERNVIEFIELSRDFDTGNRTILARKLPTSGVTEISASAPCDGGGM